MNVLGVSCWYHDSAACLIQDGRIVAAASEERFTRIKQDFNFPRNAVAYCLKEGGISVEHLDAVGFYDKPFLKFHRIVEIAAGVAPWGFALFHRALPLWMKEKLHVREAFEKEIGWQGEVVFTEHHEAHAASTFLCSPFEKAAILTMDGVGEWATTTYGYGEGNAIHLQKEIRFPHSLGMLYSAVTAYLGFKVNSGEYKVMGAAPYGKPIYEQALRDNVIDIKEDGSFRLNLDYFSYTHRLRMYNDKFSKLLGNQPRTPEARLSQHDFDVAMSIQKVCEEVVLKAARHLYKETGLDKLCMAGGVALNCVANGKIIRGTPIKELFIQPAAGDAGGAVGVALFACHSLLGEPRTEAFRSPYLGPSYSSEEAQAYLDQVKATYKRLSDEETVEQTAQHLVSQKVVGWFQGRMEFGPRALGNRSILGDPRDPKMKDALNVKIKFRESFRPFAPSVTAEDAADWFEIDRESPYMLLTAQVREGKRVIPAVTHADFSARLQTVAKEDNPRYHAVIKRFGELTGVPVIINTSFNVRGEPIVMTPEDAYRCFMRTNMDVLVVEDFLMLKEEQHPDEKILNLGAQKIELD